MSHTPENDAALDHVRGSLEKIKLAELDFHRALNTAARAGVDNRELAEAARLSTRELTIALRSTRARRDVAEGFSGSDPYEIAQRYVAGEIDRDQVIEELRRWPYAPLPEVGPLDDYAPDAPGSSEDLSAAYHRGLIDRTIMKEVLPHVKVRGQTI